MSQATPETSASLLKKSLLSALMMVGACVVFVGTLTILAVMLVGKPGKSGGSAGGDGTPVLVPADKVHGSPEGAGAGPGRPAPAGAGAAQQGNGGSPPAMIKPNQVL